MTSFDMTRLNVGPWIRNDHGMRFILGFSSKTYSWVMMSDNEHGAELTTMKGIDGKLDAG